MICYQLIVNDSWIERYQLLDIARKYEGWQYVGLVRHPVLVDEHWHLIQHYRPAVSDSSCFLWDFIKAVPEGILRAYMEQHAPEAMQLYGTGRFFLAACLGVDKENAEWAGLVQEYKPWPMARMGWYWITHHPYTVGDDISGLMKYYRQNGCKLEVMQNGVFRVMPYYATTGNITGASLGCRAFLDLQQPTVRSFMPKSIMHDFQQPAGHPLTSWQRVAIRMAEQMQQAVHAKGWDSTTTYNGSALVFRASRCWGQDETYFRAEFCDWHQQGEVKENTPASKWLADLLAELNKGVPHELKMLETIV